MTFLRILIAGLIALAAAVAHAATFPSQPIRIICTAAAGSPLDAMARAAGKQLGEVLKVPVVVENRVGGTGTVGMSLAANLPADGYTLVTATGSTSFLLADPATTFKPSDFLFFRGLQAEPSSMAVAANSPYKTLKDLVNALKADPSKVTIGGFAAAGFHQYVLYRLQQQAGFESVWVPFNGGNQAVLAVLGGHVDAVGITPSSALGQIQKGEMRLLGISSSARDKNFPDVPTYKEQGYDVVEEIWRGLMVKRGTPPEVLATLNAALDKVEASAEWQGFMKANMQAPMGLSSAQMQRHVEAEVASRREFLGRIGNVKK
ncbi:tripartite tricarboxylate transporter substrate binding protein [Hydrogenophaga sp. BPS33]|uniref:tripartite tricarboxylate transporter substrate binding protein n=1 Tax=Hydrogenophaga sp. BPS33 TaxID=2651974 RepID=UPI00131F4D0C|nr:tripartite tricarboxylate transporter substrate binding protein [Hydrogenophaga sp. BPS33]QHE85963.1 tripartite tricarboxylate transporter substrate binding protein [Hydrogenophaga sp. BPS33]